ncbi:unnamed protein product [Schistosoma turkestanicum]|nr:unnamed protein product [Schistosoma turkestanicum]
MLNEIDLLNTLPKGVDIYAPQANDKSCAEGTSDPLSPLNSDANQPLRPFSHPSHLCNKDITSPHCLEDHVDTPGVVSYPRPASTPASSKSVRYGAKKLSEFCPFSGTGRHSNPLRGENPVSEKRESCHFDSFTPSTLTPPKGDSPVDPVVNDLVNKTVPCELDDQDSLFTTKTLTFTADNNEMHANQIPSVFDQSEPWNRTDIIRAGIKRPHSASLCYTHCSDGVDLLTRPLSAPKRLIEEVHVSSNLNSILPSPNDTPISSAKFSNTNSDAPKSTLEALVASTSPLTFFPHEFPIDSECDEKFPEFAPQISHGLMNKNMNDLSYSIDLTSPNTEFSVRGEVDLNAVNTNSVSSSKSMTSLDLNDPNFKCPNSHGSQKSVYSDLGLITDVFLENNNTSAVTHMNEYVQAIRTYAAELCPVDCVILLEHCRPFNCDSLFMKYFRDQYLCPILSNLNGGPPLNADFGRDAYTSLYSLHGYCWRKPLQTTTLMPDTPIIYKILKRVATMQHESRHTSDQINPSEGTPGHELLQAAVKEFDAIDRARRGLCKKVQRHLILLAMSPIDLSKLWQSDSSFIGLEDYDSNLNSQEPLRNLKMRGVALSVFSPVQSPSLLKLYELVNGIPAAPFYDRRWQTVALSDKLMQSDIPERRIVGPMAAAFHAQTEAELSIIEHKQLSKQTLTNGHSNRMLDDSHPPTHTSALTTDHGSNNRCVVTSNNKYQIQEQNSQQSTYCTETSAYPITSNSSLNIATDSSCRANSNSTGGNISSQCTNDGLSPMAVTQFGVTASPVGSYQRAPRNPSSITSAQYPPNTIPNYSTRTISNSRSGSDNNNNTNNIINVRSVEGIAPLANSLSGGHSGPNSVDQAPGSVYGSDSVATPQGMYASQAGTVSPLQVANSSHLASQLHSPSASGGLHSHQPTPSSIHSPYNPYHHNAGHIYQNQQSLYDQNALKVMPGTSPSPNPLQNSFRPSSNTSSPSSQFIPTTVNASGLSSPCSSRVPNKQYSPQLIPHQQQGSPQNRIPCPGGIQKPIHSQFIRANNNNGSNNQLSTNNHQTNENFTTHSRSNTPTNVVYSNNAIINSSPLNNTQYGNNYMPKDTMQQHPQQPQMKISSPQPPSCLLGPDNSVVQHSSNLPQPNITVSQQNQRRSHILTNTNIPVHQSPQLSQQQPQVCPSRTLFWEGEIHMADSNSMSMTNRFPLRLLLEQCAVRDMSQINLQMWGPVAQLSIIQAYRDSPLVERLSSPLGNGQLLARLLVDLPPDSIDVNNLSALLSAQTNQMMIPLGILSPSNYRLSSPIQPGIVGFICLVYNPNRNRIHGFVPYDSEQFRQDIVMGRYTSTRSSNNMTPDMNNNPSGNHFPRVHSNSQTFPQGHVDSPAAMLNINPQYMNTPSHMGNNNNNNNNSSIIPSRDASPCNSVNPTYQYQNQSSHIPQYMPQHMNSQPQNPTKAQILGNTTTYQTIQLNQRSTPSPHSLHDNLQTGAAYMPQYPLESETSTQWITNRPDTISHQNQQISIPNNTVPNQSVRSIHSSQNSHMIQQPIPQRTGINTGYSNTTAYHGHPHSRPNLDRLAPTPMPVQCNPMTDPSIILDQPSIHNSPVPNVLSHGQQQQPHSHFIPNGARMQNTIPSNSVNSYHRNNVPQNSGYSQPQSFNQREHYMTTTQSQTHLSPSGNYQCYQSRNNMVTSNIPNPSGHRFIPGPPNIGGTLQMSNQPTHIPKHQHTPVLSQAENTNNRHGTFSHQNTHIRPNLSNMNCNSSVDNIGRPHYPIPSQDLPQHMMHTNLHGPMRQQPSYDSCGPSGGGGSGGGSGVGNSQGFI